MSKNLAGVFRGRRVVGKYKGKRVFLLGDNFPIEDNVNTLSDDGTDYTVEEEEVEEDEDEERNNADNIL